MEITIDKRGKSLLLYSKDDICNTERLLSKITNIKNLEFSPSKREEEGTVTNYFNFKLDNLKFKVRISDHTTKSASNELLSGLYFGYGHWIIDVGVGRYKPSEIIDIVNNIKDDTIKYKSEKLSKSIDKYIEENLNKDYNDEGFVEDTAEIFARGFFNKKGIKDNKYFTAYNVLKKIIFDKLNA